MEIRALGQQSTRLVWHTKGDGTASGPAIGLSLCSNSKPCVGQSVDEENRQLLFPNAFQVINLEGFSFFRHSFLLSVREKKTGSEENNHRPSERFVLFCFMPRLMRDWSVVRQARPFSIGAM